MTVGFPEVETKTHYVRFQGGLDLETPTLAINPGACLDAMNYQPKLFGGYERIDGFERYDGRARPSDAVYWYGTASISTSLLVGQSVVGITSGAVGVVAIAVTAPTTSGALVLTKVTGTFQSGESLRVSYGGIPLLLMMISTATVGTLTSRMTQGGYPTAEGDAISRNAAADIYRVDVSKVPGSGSILGVNVYNGVVYAFRNSADGTVAQMWKSTSTGWVQVTFGYEISFTGGNNSVLDGDTLTQGGNTATIARVAQTTSATSPSRVGRLIITGATGGFLYGAATTSSGGTLKLTATQTQITLAPSGRYEFQNYNFFGSTSTFYMYFASGTHRACEFDGTNLVPITTGMTVDTPKYIKCHKYQLFLSFKGSRQNSGVGLPFVWTTVTGGAEVGIGDDITGFAVMPGEALAIGARNSIHQLNGSSVDDFVEKNVSQTRGAIPRTMQEMGQTYCLDDQGVVQVSPTQAYGAFNEQIISRRAQPVTNRVRINAIASTVYRAKNQYRVYGNDGTGMILSVGTDSRGNPLVQITEFDYNSGRSTDAINVTCICAGEDSTGKDVIYFGADNGYVYQCEKGTSFDGNEIEAYIRMPFGDAKSPQIKKHYRKVLMEMSCDGYTNIGFHPEFSYGETSISSHTTGTNAISGHGGYWGGPTTLWGSFYYDAQSTITPNFKVGGDGVNMSMFFYSKSDYYASHSLGGATIYYSPRKLKR